MKHSSTIRPGAMLERLALAEELLSDPELTLLSRPDAWSTLDVDYEEPRVERLWLPFDPDRRLLGEGDHRLYGHRIHPCRSEAGQAPRRALRHRHSWPSAVRVLSGSYRMDTGSDFDDETWASVGATVELHAGSRYEMTEPGAWHSVEPIGGPSLSLMVSGPPWEAKGPSPSRSMSPLPDAARREILDLLRVTLGLG